MNQRDRQLKVALDTLTALGLPRAQQNERSALCLLALLNLPPGRPWARAEAPLLGVTPIMDWAAQHYGAAYKPNTRETFRRQTLHQFCAAGLALYNPDAPDRPVNSPRAAYQIAPEALSLLRSLGTSSWSENLATWQAQNVSLAARYAQARMRRQVPLRLANGQSVRLSPGAHSTLIRTILESFAPSFVPGGRLIYAGDTGEKWGYFDVDRLAELGVTIDAHGKMPDAIIHDPKRGWLILVEAVTSHGPVDGKRHAELARLFAHSTAGLVYVTAFPDRALMKRYLADIAWETEVWVADAPSHLIHFNGERFLGPYPT
ncbi:MAG: restriction endonuclease [Proteobacteria bacterium]|nr:restriction endonuclease [Pseudomonadota bacterium]